jgi:alpha-N-arabinofuranosidase
VAERTARAEVTLLGGGPRVSPLLFGGLAEHFGASVHDGMFDRESGVARADVKSALAAMGTRLIRYPGGCFSAGYHWRDGVGPRSGRPRHERTTWNDLVEGNPDLAPEGGTRRTPGLTLAELSLLASGPDPNSVGTDEFLQYCLDLDAEPMLVANIGTGTKQEAADWVRYTNVDRRSPRPVHFWEVGNENWGLLEPGCAPPREYGGTLAEFAQAMKAVDPTISVIGVGYPVRPGDDGPDPVRSPGGYTGTEWMTGVVEEAGEHLDGLNLHWYFPEMIGRPLTAEADYRQLVTAPDLFDDVLTRTLDLLERLSPERELFLAVDEWNRMVELEDHVSTNHALADAPFFAGVCMALLRHLPRVRIACVSHLVNCLAPVQAGDGWMFTTSGFLVLQQFSALARGRTRLTAVTSDPVDVPALADVSGRRTAFHGLEARTGQGLDAQATEEEHRQVVFLTSRHLDRPTDVTVVGLRNGVGRLRLLAGPALYAANCAEHPDVLYVAEREVDVRDGTAHLTLPPGGTGALVVS